MLRTQIICCLFCLQLVFLLSESASAAPFALFDESHGQRFLSSSEEPLGLSGLAGLLAERNGDVRASSGELTTETLKGVDLLVISGPFQPFSNAEIDNIKGYLEAGGGLLLMLHVAPPVRALLHSLDVDFSNGTLRETHRVINDNPLDFKVVDLSDHPITAGLEEFSVYGAWALRSTAGHVRLLAQTSDSAWIDLNRDGRLSNGDAVQPFGVLAAGEIGLGRYAVIGDDALFQNRFLDKANRELFERLSQWAARKR